MDFLFNISNWSKNINFGTESDQTMKKTIQFKKTHTNWQQNAHLALHRLLLLTHYDQIQTENNCVNKTQEPTLMWVLLQVPVRRWNTKSSLTGRHMSANWTELFLWNEYGGCVFDIVLLSVWMQAGSDGFTCILLIHEGKPYGKQFNPTSLCTSILLS